MYTYHWPEKLLRTENKILKRKLAKINVCVCVYECLYTVELFQILKYNAVKVMHSICHQIWKTQQEPQDYKRLIFMPIPRKGNAKECSDCHTVVFISHSSKVMLQIIQARLQQYMNWELPDVKAGFWRSRGSEIKLPTFVQSWRK